MKRTLALIAVLSLLLGLSTVAVAEGLEPTSDKMVLDATVFFEEPEIECDCMCPICLGARHMAKNGITFFKWASEEDKMPEGACFCGTPRDPWRETVVFLNGVPNLSKDLFKYWEGFTNDVYIPDSVTEIDEECFVEGSHITLHFTANNSVALAYAQTRGMAYKIVPEAPEEISEPDASEPVSEVSDPVSEPSSATSIFDLPTDWSGYGLIEDVDYQYIGMWHYLKQDCAFFRWLGEKETVPSDFAGSCFSRSHIWASTVVFWNGVPNFPKDLFKMLEGSVNDVYIPDSVAEIDEDAFAEHSTITLHFTANNEVALAYAQTRGMAFEVMDGERVSGDVDFDKNVDMKDVLSLRKSIAKLPAAYEIYSTDLNADDSTDMKDVLILRKQIATA